jgi:hypothetical protein
MTSMLFFLLAACGPNQEELAQMMQDQIELEKQRAIDEEAAALAAAEAALTPAERSQRFLALLEKLMEGYQPSLPNVVDDTDKLKCVTSYQMTNNKHLKASARKLEKDKQKSEKSRDKAREAFYAKLYLQFRIDSGWESRVSNEATYRCYDRDGWEWYDASVHRSDCTDYYDSWRLRSASDEFGNTEYSGKGIGLYSGTETPGKPELMKRIEASATTVPERFYCAVTEVKDDARWGCWGYDSWEDAGYYDCRDWDYTWTIREKKGVEITCDGPGRSSGVYFHGEMASAIDVNRGDTISVPLSGTALDPTGVLGHTKDGNWRLNATPETILMEEKAQCPAIAEIVATTKK